MDAAVSTQPAAISLAPATSRVRLTLPESATSCSCASSTCAIASESHRIACGTWSRQLCAWFHQASVGGPGEPNQPMSAFVTVTLAANMRGGMWTQIAYEGKSDQVQPHGPLFPRQLVSHSPTHRITQEGLLDMIDAIDTDMNAGAGDAELIPWLLFPDRAPHFFCARSEMLSRWWLATVYDTKCLQSLKQTNGCSLWSRSNRWCPWCR